MDQEIPCRNGTPTTISKSNETIFLIHYSDSLMDTTLLTSFLEVAQRLHFGQAADSLGMTQPALSHQIRRLEQQVGATLFNRTSRTVHLTEAGQVLVPQARQVLATLERAVFHCRAVAGGRAGNLKIGSIGAALSGITPHLVRGLHERLPGLTVQLTQMDSPLQLAALRTGELDLGVVRLTGPIAGVHLRDLYSEPMTLAVPHDHPLASLPTVAAKDLRDQPFILWPRTTSQTFYDQVLAYCNRAGFQPRIVMEATDVETQLGLVSAGIGVSPQPASFTNLGRKGIVFRTLVEAPESTVQLAWLEASPPQILQTVIDIAAAVHREKEAGKGPW